MTVRRRVAGRVARLNDRLFDRMRDRRAFEVTDDGAVDADLRSLRGHTYVLLVTFRRNGEAVPSPVWMGVDDDGVAYVRTTAEAGKVKRIRNDARVVVVPSTMRGAPTGPAIRATATVLGEEESAHAEAVLAAACGGVRAVFERTIGASTDGVYLAIRPRPA